jgi:membrane dipeptidase
MKIIDMHCDTFLRIYEADYELGEKIDLLENNFHVDLKKLIASKSMAQFFALYLDLEQKYKNDEKTIEYCLGMLDCFYMELEKNKDKIAIARNYNEMNKNISEGKISAFLTIEEGGAIQGKLCNLRNFYRLGVRLMTLTWNYPNEIGYPHMGEEFRNMGLTEFGKEVVHEMNRLGMIVDVSHLSDGGFYDVAALSTVPFIASHSNARSIKGNSRNLTDDMIKTLAEKGGVTGINFSGNFLSEDNVSRIDDMILHIKHIKNVGGIDVIALGTDFDGIDGKLEIKNIGEIGILIHALEKNGFSQKEIDKISYKNASRVIKDVMK